MLMYVMCLTRCEHMLGEWTQLFVQAMVQRYHIYQHIRDAACEIDLLNCERQPGNHHCCNNEERCSSSWIYFEDNLYSTAQR